MEDRDAIQGDPEAISTLPKFVTSLGELAIVSELTLDNLAAVQEWHARGLYLQNIGSFNPQHVGHVLVGEGGLLAHFAVALAGDGERVDGGLARADLKQVAASDLR